MTIALRNQNVHTVLSFMKIVSALRGVLFVCLLWNVKFEPVIRHLLKALIVGASVMMLWINCLLQYPSFIHDPSTGDLLPRLKRLWVFCLPSRSSSWTIFS